MDLINNSWEQTFVFKASNGAVTEPYNGSWLGALVNYFGYGDDLYGGSYIQTICFHYGITEPVNVSWYQALCYHFGLFEPINASWKYTLAFIDATPVIPVSDTNWEDVDFNWEDSDEWTLIKADFSVDNQTIVEGATASFTDTSYSLNPITNYYWEFEGGNPTYSVSINPIVEYSTPGSYDVKLTVSNDDDGSVIIKPNYMTIQVDIDPDAAAFLSATGITDQTQTDAIVNLVEGLKTEGIWDKMFAIYPFIGGTATTHKFNLKDPRDLDVAYRLTMGGTLTHNSTGVLGSTSGFMDTKLPVNWTNFNTDIHLSFYSRVNVVGSGNNNYDMGLSNRASLGNPTLNGDWALMSRFSDNRFYAALPDYTNNSVSNTDATGFYQANRIGNQILGYKNNTLSITNNSPLSGVSNNGNMYILAINVAGTAQGFSPRQVAYSSIGRGLTATQMVAHYNLVQAYQTALNRQV